MRLRRAHFAGGTGTWADALSLLLRLARHHGDGLGELERCHDALRQYLGVRHVFTYGAARMGLYEVLRSLGVGPGDEVVVPGFTCAVVINAIRFNGARPVYADIELERLGPDVQAVERAISPRTRAVIAHHLFGVPCDIEGVLAVGRRVGLPVIEDAAMALGGRFQGRLLGTFGPAAVFSCEASKMISTGSGGILVLTDDQLASRVQARYADLPFQELRESQLAMQRWLLTFLEGSPIADWPYNTICRQVRRLRQLLGRPRLFACETAFGAAAVYENEYRGVRSQNYPWRMPANLAWLLRRQLERLDVQVAHRCELAAELEVVLTRKGAAVPRVDWAKMRPAWLRFPFWVDDPDRWVHRLRRADIQFDRWFEGPVHPARCMANPWFGYEAGSCPRGEWLGKRILNLPITPRIQRWLVRRVQRL